MADQAGAIRARIYGWEDIPAERRLLEQQEAAMSKSLAKFKGEITGKAKPTQARDRDGPALTLRGRSRAEEPPLGADPKPEIDPERLRATREARERQELFANPEKAREHIRAKARELREKITARDKHKVAMEKMRPGSLDHRAAEKKLGRLEGKVQEADLALKKSCKELAETLGKQTVKAEVGKVLGLEKAGVVMQRCGLEKAVKHKIKGISYSR